MRNERIRTIAEIGLSLALFAVLTQIKVTLPMNIAGGSISLAMAPIIILALLRGFNVGILAGVLAGFIDYLLSPYMFSIPQVILDYPIAFGLLGVAGLLSAGMWRAHKEGKVALVASYAAIGTLFAVFARGVAHFFSGVLFFASNAPEGTPAWLYSLEYQISYLVPAFVGCVIVAIFVVPVLARVLDQMKAKQA